MQPSRYICDITIGLPDLFARFTQLKSTESSPLFRKMNVYTYPYHKSCTIFASVLYRTYNNASSTHACMTTTHVVKSIKCLYPPFLVQCIS